MPYPKSYPSSSATPRRSSKCCYILFVFLCCSAPHRVLSKCSLSNDYDDYLKCLASASPSPTVTIETQVPTKDPTKSPTSSKPTPPPTAIATIKDCGSMSEEERGELITPYLKSISSFDTSPTTNTNTAVTGRAFNANDQALKWIIYKDGLKLCLPPTSPTNNDNNISEGQQQQKSVDEKLLIQRYVLALLYFTTNGENWTKSDGFLSDDSECSWFGVRCDDDGFVTHVHLGENNLSGPIPHEITHLSQLQKVDLNSNHITGNIPSKIDNLQTLQTLHFNNNKMTGPLPETLWSLQHLKYLNLHGNGFVGAISSSIGNCASLTRLRLHDNEFTGVIPHEIASLIKLTYLSLDNNYFHGEISPAICKHHNNNNNKLKYLSADCTTVIECDCCTKCFPQSTYDNDIDTDDNDDKSFATGGVGLSGGRVDDTQQSYANIECPGGHLEDDVPSSSSSSSTTFASVVVGFKYRFETNLNADNEEEDDILPLLDNAIVESMAGDLLSCGGVGRNRQRTLSIERKRISAFEGMNDHNHQITTIRSLGGGGVEGIVGLNAFPPDIVVDSCEPSTNTDYLTCKIMSGSITLSFNSDHQHTTTSHNNNLDDAIHQSRNVIQNHLNDKTLRINAPSTNDSSIQKVRVQYISPHLNHYPTKENSASYSKSSSSKETFSSIGSLLAVVASGVVVISIAIFLVKRRYDSNNSTRIEEKSPMEITHENTFDDCDNDDDSEFTKQEVDFSSPYSPKNSTVPAAKNSYHTKKRRWHIRRSESKRTRINKDTLSVSSNSNLHYNYGNNTYEQQSRDNLPTWFTYNVSEIESNNDKDDDEVTVDPFEFPDVEEDDVNYYFA